MEYLNVDICPKYGPVPDESPLYSSYRGKAPPFPGNTKDPIFPTKHGQPATDDKVWQNLLSAKWIIFSFYRQGVEAFNKTAFIEPGYPNTTYDRIQEIRNNEAGHLRIFQDKKYATVFPYANQILDTTNAFVVKGSCTKENPPYPSPRQNLPRLSANPVQKTVSPGSLVSLNFTGTPKFEKDHKYYTTFFHGPWNISVPIDTKDWPKKKIEVEIPKAFEARGVIIAVVTDTTGAPTLDSVVAGPNIILQQPAELGAKLATTL
ncbi:putative stress response protein rds1p-like protein [Fusarium austroafricanum]|uniref:Putative stress response protein rds1p-like protein n=1 Tax=Fusarium austroafricanum TaxID=2364996 RepID=A0A8H4K9N1_9HYPO|nr:putative stress response protein rds1p-like protein [Fusarium austroafricanum]